MVDPVRAVELYTRTIQEDGDTNAMRNLRCVLRSDANNVDAKSLLAVELFSRAVGEGNNTSAMLNLGILLEKGSGLC